MTGFTVNRFIEERGQGAAGAAGVRGGRTFVYAYSSPFEKAANDMGQIGKWSVS